MLRAGIAAALIGTAGGPAAAQPTAAAPQAATAHPAAWPQVKPPPRDPAIEARIAALLAAMPVEDKVAQIIQVDIDSVTPNDLRTVKLGSVLNGGNSSPGHNETAPPRDWLALADAFWDASMARTDGRPAIPVIWGTDAVHGHNNIVGATLFPHNIGLGNARDPGLVRRIGAATAAETAATGIDWSFAPTLAVVQDDRWGRTYESYSQAPAIVADYAGAMVEGLQGAAGTADFMGARHVIATAKHFLGDGGTGGHDQGDTRADEATLQRIHGAGYPPAIRAGVLTVMASFSSWNGAKMHGNRSLLTAVLKQRLGFDGLVVGDWNAHAQLPGCSVEHCAAAINAGLDMFMVSGDWRALYRNTLGDVARGAIPMARLDDAVTRILRVKAAAGVLDRGRPSSRTLAGRFDELGSPAHRALAREAVRKSLVLLKNDGVLPLRARANILVAGGGADNIAQQSGGWTISWQGTGVTNADFPHAQSIWSGIADAVRVAGGTATLSADGRYARRPDAAIVVFGEQPYAEFQGDRATLDYSPGDRADLALLQRLRAAGVPVVAVFLSGRPLWVNAELNASNAFVAAFLPGTEGGGVADLLFRKPDGGAPRDFTGRLAFAWPRRPDQYDLQNPRDAPLFAFGYGLSYAHPGRVPLLDAMRPAGLATGASGALFERGRIGGGLRWDTTGAVTVSAADRRAQEDARRFVWTGAGSALLAAAVPLDLTREVNGELSLVVELRVDAAAAGPVAVAATPGRAVDATAALGAIGAWTELSVPLRCFAGDGFDPARVAVPFALSGPAGFAATVSGVRIASVAQPTLRCR